MRTLVLGGARSGKSAFAEGLVGASDCVYVATARPWPGDTDFDHRIDQHRRRRPASWSTEETTDAVTILADPPQATVLVDDLGTWLTHTIDRRQAWEQPRGTTAAEIDTFVAAVAAYPADRDLILVSPEVGMGIIPEHRAGRLFRDEIGALNAAVAEACEQVAFVIAGQVLWLKR
ncbi:MAG: bifunctional adenosylcobinamide kinase/adenosylcobinamide-phosphate guanylyltransferase [Corynebacterium sp.]|uniref:bifunctional adenosylcobinamide kinase/adenosylcobinamide-phosphate guanylyltransferase n=1 Tax=Corynebacterium sp. TaxID=1720 RepID=UPI0026DB39CB|nr:bifunctional adenosylcobinamide kinase/adenosylcobinamide-phosphate guanylyltransferase [Corynebacterium sp.]MDO5097877.1 bifunctional adenosylcobinamide kinase/adenosylcobinamide-phosphate guanylyltransferase [Corynebacterium sp.]